MLINRNYGEWHQGIPKELSRHSYNYRPVLLVEQLAPRKPVLHCHIQGIVPETPHDHCLQNLRWKAYPEQACSLHWKKCLAYCTLKYLAILRRGGMNLKRFASKTCSPHKINFIFASSLSTRTICFRSVHLKGSKGSIFSILQEKAVKLYPTK